MSFWDEKDLSLELPLYNAPIERPYMKRLNNINLLLEFPFYNRWSILKTSEAFRRYARSYNLEIIDSKDPSVQLTASKPSIEDFFDDLLNENKSFKYQTTVKVWFKKYKENGDTKFDPVYFNSTTKAVINLKYDLDKSLQKVFI